jgi:RNA polymerase sigma-70 factor (ECF subfamily)
MTAIEFNHQLVSLESNLSRFALSLTSDRDEAKDLLQETLLKAITYREQFVSYTNLKAWTYTIMKNTFINNYRRIVRQNNTLDSTKNLYFLNQSRKTNDMTPDSNYATLEINKLIDGLDDEFKMPFKLLLEGFKYKEISEKLGLKLGTVKSRIFFTRKKLMELLNDVF